MGGTRVDAWEFLVAETQDEGVVTEVIRPAAVVPEEAARAFLMQLALRDVPPRRTLGHRARTVAPLRPLVGRAPTTRPSPRSCWADPGRLRRADPLRDHHLPGHDHPGRQEQGWTVEALCDEALAYGDLSLASCPRADLKPPPQPFQLDSRRARSLSGLLAAPLRSR